MIYLIRRLLLSMFSASSIFILWMGLEDRMRRKYLQSTFFIMLYSMVGMVIDSFIIEFIDTNIQVWVALNRFVLDIFLLTIMAWILFKVPILEVLFEVLIIYPLWCFISLLAAMPSYAYGYFVDSWVNQLCINGLIILISLLVHKVLPIQRLKEIYFNKTKGAGVLILSWFLFAAGIVSIDALSPGFIYSYFYSIVAMSMVLVLITMIIIIYIIKVQHQQKIIETHEKYNPVISDLMGEMRRRQHDFKNHLQVIYALSRTTEEKNLSQEIQGYINSLQDSLREVEDLMHMDNRVMAALIYSKTMQAAKEGVSFGYEVVNGIPKYPLENYELTEVLGNLIDNALDAVRDYENRDKTVILQMGYEGEKAFLEVRNTGTSIQVDRLDQLFRRGVSTKGAQGRGYGLYNVSSLVEKYKGKIEVACIDGFTVFKLIF